MKKKLMIFLVLSLLLVSGCSSSDESSDSEKKKTDMENGRPREGRVLKRDFLKGSAAGRRG